MVLEEGIYLSKVVKYLAVDDAAHTWRRRKDINDNQRSNSHPSTLIFNFLHYPKVKG